MNNVGNDRLPGFREHGCEHENLALIISVIGTNSSDDRIAYGGRGQITDVQQPRDGRQVMDVLLPCADRRCLRPRRSSFSGQATSGFPQPAAPG